MSQFYLPGSWAIEAKSDQLIYPIELDLVHHLRVRRIQNNELFQVFDGLGNSAKAILVELNSKNGLIKLSEIRQNTENEPLYKISLAQGLAGGDKMDWIIEKAVEIGVKEIAPLQCERSVVKLVSSQKEKVPSRAEKRHEHWRGIIQASCEQCERTILPILQPLEDFHSYITKAHSTQIKILLSPNGHSPLIDFVSGLIPQDMILAIGPEGGFSPAEESLAKANGYQILSLGKRVLRTETAGIVAITAVHTAWELRK